MATYAIGDLQGCFASFQKLLQHCAFDPARDQLWLVGDLVNRGPRSLETLRYVRDLGRAAITVLGNHDLSLLMAAEGLGRRSKDDTFDDVLQAPDREVLLHWLRQQRLCYVHENYALIHAGLLPQWSITQAQALAGEVESALRGANWREFLTHLWGSKPAQWQDALCGWARLRVIVNGMTRLRFCDAQGTMEFQAKGELTAAPTGCMPWFNVPERQSRTHTLITGHWSALGLKISANHLALDSGCLWGGKLSAIRLEDRQVFQVDCVSDEAIK